MATSSPSVHVKVLFCGQQGVGKTSLVNRLRGYDFTSSVAATIGAQNSEHKHKMIGHPDCSSLLGEVLVDLDFWDMQGQDLTAHIPSYFGRGAHIVFCVTKYPVNDESLSIAEKWLVEAQNATKESAPIYLLVNMCDMCGVPGYDVGPEEEYKTKLDDFVTGRGRKFDASRIHGWCSTSAKESINLPDYPMSKIESVAQRAPLEKSGGFTINNNDAPKKKQQCPC